MIHLLPLRRVVLFGLILSLYVLMSLKKLGFELFLFMVLSWALLSIRTLSKSVYHILNHLKTRKYEEIKSNTLLVTAYLERNAQLNESSTKNLLLSLKSITACTARSLKIDYQFEKVSNSPKFSSWPYPHYVKIYVLESYFNNQVYSKYEWFLWLDTDVRIINLQYPIQSLIHYADRQNSHVIVNSQKSYSTTVNNVFLIRNSFWGRKFLNLWKSYALGGPSCGNYDQCPFSFAMLQMISDYYNEARTGNVTEKIAWSSDASLAKAYLIEKLDLQVSQSTGFSKNQSSILPVGPILMAPSWNKRFSEQNPISSALSREPTCDMELIDIIDQPWPLSLHAKYSKLFCPEGKRFSRKAREAFVKKYRKQLERECSLKELHASRKQIGLECWASNPI